MEVMQTILHSYMKLMDNDFSRSRSLYSLGYLAGYVRRFCGIFSEIQSATSTVGNVNVNLSTEKREVSQLSMAINLDCYIFHHMHNAYSTSFI